MMDGEMEEFNTDLLDALNNSINDSILENYGGNLSFVRQRKI